MYFTFGKHIYLFLDVCTTYSRQNNCIFDRIIENRNNKNVKRF